MFHIAVIFSTIIIIKDHALNDINPQSAARCRQPELRMISMIGKIIHFYIQKQFACLTLQPNFYVLKTGYTLGLGYL